VIDEDGLSVISDIDDTVKVTNVANRRELLANTLFREFRAVTGMPEIYREWEAHGAAFHYVSASPWQLASCLERFLGESGIPGGSTEPLQCGWNPYFSASRITGRSSRCPSLSTAIST
jgi:phosphatidate phosphatase APP1